MEDKTGQRLKGKRGNKKRKEEQQAGRSKAKYYAAAAGICLAALSAGFVTGKVLSEKKAAVLQAARMEREKSGKEKAEEEKRAAGKAAQELGSQVLGFPAESAKNVMEALENRPPSVELTEENREGFAQIASCKIDSELDKIVVETLAEGIPVSDDKYYYLFSIKALEKELGEEAACIGQEYKDERVEFQISRSGAPGDIFRKFLIAVKKDGKYVAVSNSSYITNPGAASKFDSGRKETSSKKGLLVDPNKLRTSELDDLGVKHASYNIPVSRILGNSTDGIHPTIQYNYRGKSYSFNGQVMSEYDLVFGILTSKGIEVTAILLNDISPYSQLIHPMARSGLGSAPYYAFNGSDEAGQEYLAAIGSFLAERYSSASSGKGLVTNWIIGNEVNARKEWNYMEHVDLETYVKEYAKAFRVFYNAIKSTNGSCNIYISLDQQWDRNNAVSGNYDARDILDVFNREIKAEGNIDWGLAIHPYNVPLTTPYIWNAGKYVKASVDTPMVTMANIHIVTDYMQQEQFLTEEGDVRSIILSELGYTSSKGEEVQAAAMVYAYKVAEANQHIDSILFSRQTDAVEEIAQGLALGLNRPDGSHKYAYNVYKYMDTEQGEKHTGFAKNIVGISGWGEVIKQR